MPDIKNLDETPLTVMPLLGEQLAKMMEQVGVDPKFATHPEHTALTVTEATSIIQAAALVKISEALNLHLVEEFRGMKRDLWDGFMNICASLNANK